MVIGVPPLAPVIDRLIPITARIVTTAQTTMITKPIFFTLLLPFSYSGSFGHGSSALHRTQRHTCHEIFLQDGVNHQDRNCGDHSDRGADRKLAFLILLRQQRVRRRLA